MYREVVLDHYRSPRGAKKLANCKVQNDGKNPVCGDEVTLCLDVDGTRVRDISVTTQGCSICTASGSMMAELMPGLSREEAGRLIEGFKSLMHGGALPEDMETGDLDTLKGVQKFPVRIKCALLPWTTLEAALKTWKKQSEQAAIAGAPSPATDGPITGKDSHDHC